MVCSGFSLVALGPNSDVIDHQNSYHYNLQFVAYSENITYMGQMTIVNISIGNLKKNTRFFMVVKYL